MIEKNWNGKNIALSKDKLSKEEIELNINTAEIRHVVKDNEAKARELLYAFPSLDKAVISFFETHTQNDGSVDVTGIKFSSDFFKREGVCFQKGRITTTRGYDYICSLDTGLTSVQKIEKYQETIHLTIEELKADNIDKIEKLLLLDYLKNALITILNTFVYQEKLEIEEVDRSEEYEKIRSQLIKNAEDVISGSVDLILNKELHTIQSIDFENILSITDDVVDRLSTYHTSHKLPSFYVSRPEATNPMTIIGSSILLAENYKNIDAIVGVPSGGTELALTTKVFMNKLTGKKYSLLLLPISLHTLKKFSGKTNNEHVLTQLNIEKHFENNIESVLICDDNTSTGRTLQLLKNLILKHNPNIVIHCAVAEADIVRSNIDKDNIKRTHVANKDILKDSVNILPVSRSIDPKVDIKEIIEKRKIISYYENMASESTKLIDTIYANVMERVNEFGVDYSDFTDENAVLAFRGTFLSNFYSTPIIFNGVTYPSVEHAYQAAKFSNFNWSAVKQEAIEEIQNTFKLRGYSAHFVLSNEFFADEKMTSGNIKIATDILRNYGYVDTDWEDKRIKIMINLLIQKFQSKEMASLLQATRGKELIEGNDWGDTLWGVCDGKGRNILGVILMAIRK